MEANDESGNAKLVRRILGGDQNAFQMLEIKYKTRLLLYVSKKVGNREDAQEIVQDTFVEIHRNLYRLKQSEKLPNWMFKIALQCLRTWRRKNRDRIRYASDDDMPNKTMALKEAAIIDHRVRQQRAERTERYERSRKAISKLPESQRSALLLHYIDGMSHKEIAQELDISEVAVNSLLARAREKVRGIVLKMEDD